MGSTYLKNSGDDMMNTLLPLDEEDCLIRIDGLVLDASIGIYPHELSQRQSLFVDIAMTIKATAAAASDDIRYTVDYDHVVACLKSLVERRHFNLLETLSKDMVHTLADSFNVDRLIITVCKPAAVPSARQVSVTRSLDRSRPAIKAQLSSVV